MLKRCGVVPAQVVAVAVNSGLVTFPVSYSVAYKTAGLTIWIPEAPEGYAALGCVANPGEDPPALTEVACIATGIGRVFAQRSISAFIAPTKPSPPLDMAVICAEWDVPLCINL